MCCSPWGHKELDMTERLNCEGFIARLLSLFINFMCTLSRVRLFETPWTAAYQAPPPMGFSRQEYWSGVPLPSPPSVYSLC